MTRDRITEPTDAEVREAVESLQRMVDMDTFMDATVIKMRTLLSYVRAVQAPRPLWPDDDPMIVAMAAERDALAALAECEVKP